MNTTKMPRSSHTFTVGWLYPDLMNIYGDRGNILTLLKRAECRGYEAKLVELGRGTVNQMVVQVNGVSLDRGLLKDAGFKREDREKLRAVGRKFLDELIR